MVDHNRTGSQVEDMVMALVDAANDKDASVVEMVKVSLLAIGLEKPELVLGICKDYILKHHKMTKEHRVVLLESMEKILHDKREELDADLAKELLKLAFQEMTKSKEIHPKWQTAASLVIVSVGKTFKHEVMSELLENLVPGTPPHYFVILTLANFAQADAFALVPFLKDILGRLLPMLMLTKQDNMRWVFAHCFSRFSESITYYLANIESTDHNDIKQNTFEGEMQSAYEILFNVWIKSNEPKVRLAIIEAIGYMSHLLPREKLSEQLPRLFSGINSLYKKHPAGKHYTITISLCRVLEAAVADGEDMLTMHLDHLLNDAFDKACVMPDFNNPETVKNSNEVLRCFDTLCKVFSDRIISFLLLKLDKSGEKGRLGSLSVLKQLVNFSGAYLENKKPILVTGVQVVVNDTSLKVKQMLAQLIAAMAHHGYLNLEGGQRLVEFIVKQCAINVEEEKQKKSSESDSVSNKSIQAMCESILRLVTTTIEQMENVLWPYLLEFLVHAEYTCAITSVCQNLCILAGKKRERDLNDFSINFVQHVNLPKAVPIMARLLVLAGHPFTGKERGKHVLSLLLLLSPIIHSNVNELWTTIIPKLTQYIDDNEEGEKEWEQKSWEDLLLKFFSRTLDEVDDEDWSVAVGTELGNQIPLYNNQSKDKNFLYKCSGVVMKVVSKKSFIQSQLSVIFSSTKHADKDEKEGCAIAYGFCASKNLDEVLLKLETITKNEMVPKSSGFLGLMKDKSSVDVERIKSTVMWCFGYVALYGPPSLIASRLETSVYRVISPHLAQPKDLGVRQSLIHCVELIARACHPNHLQQAKSTFSKRKELLQHMINYINNESHSTISTETRGIALNACTQLIKLDPKLSEESIETLVLSTARSVYTVVVDEKTTADELAKDSPQKLFAAALEAHDDLMSEVVRKDPSPVTLDKLLKCLHQPWLCSDAEITRQRSLKTMIRVLQTYEEVVAPTSEDNFFVFGNVLAYFVPRCTDPCTGIRQDALSAVQTALSIAAKYDKDKANQEKKEKLTKAFDVLKQRAQDDDSNILFSVANDLAKFLSKRVSGDQLSFLINGLIEALSDTQTHSSSGACVVLNSLFRIRGSELGGEIPSLATRIHNKLPEITHIKTRTGTLRCFRTLGSHHLVPLLKTLLDFPLPMNWDTVDIWKSLGGEPSLVPEVLDHLVNLLNVTLPYQEKIGKDDSKKRTATLLAMAVTYAFNELFWSEEITELVSKQFPRLFACLLIRIGTCIDLQPPVLSKEKKDKGKSPELQPLKSALATMKIFLIRSQRLELSEFLDAEEIWNMFEDEETFPEGVCGLARGVCKTEAQHVRDLINVFTPVMSSAYDNQRVVVTAFFSELINCQCGGELELVDMIVANMMGRLVDSNHVVRKYCIRGLGNVGNTHETMVQKHATTILSAMMTGMDDRDDPESDLTLEAMAGLSKILAVVDESNVRHIFINICLRIRPCFIKVCAFTLFGNLSRFGNGPSKGPFLEQIHANFVTLLVHMNEEPEVTKACKCALRKLAPLMGSQAITDMFLKHLLENANLHYGEFMRDLSRLIIKDLSDKVDFYIMTCVTFFKSSLPEIQCNAAILLGFLLGNLPENKRLTISKEYVCGALITLLKDTSANVRCKAAEAMSLLYDY
ncbi:maestro heat-like repeat-containing protein family member 1 [Xenia sp. Carnegie-2017]|uniref:maestro heat-like repeat-containing protein family member 1 n=1 Tax=Xenia sp. Carnegie-2017 TaxID=2897299 RepID=UPI001F04B017|nr:maestro heat-like repeat-containing protein family member 1 [Xenia sp. Carnegie-2017]